MISAADNQLIFLAIAFNNTSCSFIIRSTSRAGMLQDIRAEIIAKGEDDDHTTYNSVVDSFRLHCTSSADGTSEYRFHVGYRNRSKWVNRPRSQSRRDEHREWNQGGDTDFRRGAVRLSPIAGRHL